ncbi:MAG: adenylosuccinate synthase [Chlamydiales bacterium]|nr:adenylosuccinate synthase [Chlamydiales bacterium]
MGVCVLVGLQWGDEGKGKIVDALADQYSHVIRGQGGHNAGHTVIVNNKQHSFHLLPSGILHPHMKCYIGAGVVINPEQLLKEIEGLGFNIKDRLFVSPYAHVILPRHVGQDQLQEKNLGNKALGTTGRGIGPCYTEKVGRSGIKIGEFLGVNLVKNYFHQEEEYDAYVKWVKKLSCYIAPVEYLINEAINKGESVLLEGAQGSLLDIQFGTYPYVTSSSTIAAGVCTGAGIGPSKISSTLGLLKAYQTRVGNGPFPTELSKTELLLFPDNYASREIGTTTGRLRRIGWLDLVAAKFAATINGVDRLVITKLDILSNLKEIKVCTSYETQEGETVQFYQGRHEYDLLKPKYKTLSGWNKSLSHITQIKDLPKEAREYVAFIEDYLSVQVAMISIGPSRNELVKRD